jgi:ABC-type transport system involved in multi-copper enzyme maturation permease subunit
VGQGGNHPRTRHEPGNRLRGRDGHRLPRCPNAVQLHARRAGTRQPRRAVLPRWLRLTRVGDLITSYDSVDGAHWTEIGTARLTSFPHTVQIGLFVTSPLYFAAGANNGTPSVATASFDQVSTRGDLPDRSWTGDAITGLYPDLPSASTWQQPSADAFTISGSGDIASLVGGEGVATHWSGASIVNGTIAGLLIVIVLATLFVTSEYRRGLIRTTLTASPRRGRVLAAKAVVAGTLAFAAGAIATAIAEVITRHVFAANGNYLFPQSGPALARVIIGAGLFLGLAAALVVALATMLRRSARAVAAGILLVMLPGILATSLPAGADSWLMRVTPTAAIAIQATLPYSNLVTAAYTPANGYFPISPWTGLAVLAAYTAVALSAARWFSTAETPELRGAVQDGALITPSASPTSPQSSANRIIGTRRRAT